MSVGIGILGGGNVGGQLARRLLADRAAIAAKSGVDLEVRRIAVRSLEKPRAFVPTDDLLTQKPLEVVEDHTVDLVVEVMGGAEPAGDLVLRALRAGKPVVTANKELIATRGPELLSAAEVAGVSLLFEAAVGGGIPIIRPLSETLAGEKLTKVTGIVNGTTNFILTTMTEEGRTYEEALRDAQRLGYAEPDPTDDISGTDAAYKAAILAGLAFGTWVGLDGVYWEGIEKIDRADLEFAAELGYVVKLLAIASMSHAGIVARVHPAMIRSTHPLASIRGATNAIFIEGPSVNQLLFAGPGAGGDPTASALLGDIIDAARELPARDRGTTRIRFAPGATPDFAEMLTKWYLRLIVVDRPGVLAQIAGVFADAQVSIKSVRQEGTGDEATLLIVTHDAKEKSQRQAADRLTDLEVVRDVTATLRVESEEV